MIISPSYGAVDAGGLACRSHGIVAGGRTRLQHLCTQAPPVRAGIHRRAAGGVLCSEYFRVATVSLDRADMACTAADHGVDDGPGRRFQHPCTPHESGLETDHRSLPVSLCIRTALRGARHSRNPIQVFCPNIISGARPQGKSSRLREKFDNETGQEPIVVGMSKWSVAAPLSFYNRSGEPMEIRSRNLFGDSGAMYDFWYPSEPPTTRPIILVGMRSHDLEHTSKNP